jgi:hypothetical protein
MLLCDCDDFTRRHYKERYGVDAMEPLQLAEVREGEQKRRERKKSIYANSTFFHTHMQ